MLTPSTITIPQGGTGLVAVTTTLGTGVAQNLHWSITGIPPAIPVVSSFSFGVGPNTLPPPGVVATFSPNLSEVGAAVSLQLLVGNVVPGTYVLQVIATGDYEVAQEALTLIITASTFTF